VHGITVLGYINTALISVSALPPLKHLIVNCCLLRFDLALSAVLGHPDGLPASLADPPRDPTASLPPALLSLEVPLQRLRAEADILRGSLTPHPSTATSSSAQHQRSVSSPNLMPSPTVVWGGYVW
jgi:hypothetical protein